MQRAVRPPLGIFLPLTHATFRVLRVDSPRLVLAVATPVVVEMSGKSKVERNQQMLNLVPPQANSLYVSNDERNRF